MRILITTGIFPPDAGGPASYVPRIAAELMAHGHTCTVLTLTNDVCNDSYYPFQVICTPRNKSFLGRTLQAIVEIIRLGSRAEVLYVNGLALEAMLANKVLRKPMVQKIVGDLAWERSVSKEWTTDGIEAFQQRQHGGRIAFLKQLRIWTAEAADVIITPSEYMRSIVSGWGIPNSKIQVIYNALELNVQELTNTRPEYLGTRNTNRMLHAISVGRMVSWKGLETLVDVARKLSWLRLTLVGDGPEYRKLRNKVARLDLSERVHFTGRILQSQVLQEMARADVFILNSGYEGLPHVALEALAVGLPLLLSNVGGNPEVVIEGKNGFLFEYDSHTAIIEKLSFMYRGGLRQFSRDAVQATLDRFRWQSLYTQTENVLASVI